MAIAADTAAMDTAIARTTASRESAFRLAGSCT
jgi:hypothetical protein